MKLVEAAWGKNIGRIAVFRTAWFLFATITVILFAGALPSFSRLVTETCVANCSPLSIPLHRQTIDVLAALGINQRVYAGYLILLSLSHAVVAIALCSLVVWRKGSDWRVLLTAGAGIASLPLLSPVFFAFALAHEPWHFPFSFLRGISFVVAGYALFLFPNGRFQPQWTRWLAHAFALAIGFWLLFPDLPVNPVYYRMVAALFPETIVAIAIVISIATIVLLNRHRLMGALEERQQIKWVVWGTVIAMLLLLFPFVPLLAYLGLNANLLAVWFALHPEVVAIMLYPVAVTGAILSHRLWDIDKLLNRTLVYGGLSLGIVAVYAILVVGLGTLLQAQGNYLLTLLATGFIAMLFHPLRSRLQSNVNRWLYGERDDPAGVLTRLTRQLETTESGGLLIVLVETVATSLKLPYVGLWLYATDGELLLTAQTGSQPVHIETLPLLHQQGKVGELVVAQRAPDEALSSADRQLLAAIARLTATIARTIQLTDQVQEARVRTVSAREEERRRLRRDLHDGLGPVLASQGLKLAAACQLVREKPEVAERLLDEVMSQSENTVAEIRRLVYALRPPTLDELGLVEAIREHVQVVGTNAGVQIVVNAPAVLPEIPAAIEV
ncbi:hypothetical protein GC175_33515, partial [bacterium]|nr:hypothetical protein [bacterium]